MARAPLNPPGPVKEKAWKVRHQGMICMLAKEVGPSGRLGHELIQRVKFKNQLNQSLFSYGQHFLFFATNSKFLYKNKINFLTIFSNLNLRIKKTVVI